MNYSLRTIQYEHDCEPILNKIEAEYGDSAIIGFEWSLTRKPEEWPRVPGTNLYMARTLEPLIRVFYTFDDNLVYVRQIDIGF